MEDGLRLFSRRETTAHLMKMCVVCVCAFCVCGCFVVTFAHDGALALFVLDEVGRLQCRFKTLAHVMKQQKHDHEHQNKHRRHESHSESKH